MTSCASPSAAMAWPQKAGAPALRVKITKNRRLSGLEGYKVYLTGFKGLGFS